MDVRSDWTLSELQKIYEMPLLSLITAANTLHCHYHCREEVQLCYLISVKTGGCPEDCRYCSQSSVNTTSVKPTKMMELTEVVHLAKEAIANGATRICLGAAWRQVKDGKPFDEIIKMVTAISALGAEVCCTLGMLNDEQAKRLKEAGLHSYNHNLDTSEQYYSQVTTTRTYEDRIKTLNQIEKANIHVCCGGILGLGESKQDRLELLLTLCRRDPHPSSVPINRLIPVPGTPFSHHQRVTVWELARMLATARIAMPRAMLRLSAGRTELSYEAQALCFLAGANSIHTGDKLLTQKNNGTHQDLEMLQILGLRARPCNK